LPYSLPRNVARLRLIAAILVGVIGPEVFIVQPGFVQGLVQNLGFDDQGAGYAASIEVWGITATTLVMTFFSHRFNWRKVITGSLLVVAVANAACIAVHSKEAFVALRFLAGAGAGRSAGPAGPAGPANPRGVTQRTGKPLLFLQAGAY